MHFTNNRLLGDGIRENPFLKRLNERLFSLTAWKFSSAFSSPSAALSTSPGATLRAAARSIAEADRLSFCSWRLYVSENFEEIKPKTFYSNKNQLRGVPMNKKPIRLPMSNGEINLWSPYLISVLSISNFLPSGKYKIAVSEKASRFRNLMFNNSTLYWSRIMRVLLSGLKIRKTFCWSAIKWLFSNTATIFPFLSKNSPETKAFFPLCEMDNKLSSLNCTIEFVDFPKTPITPPPAKRKVQLLVNIAALVSSNGLPRTIGNGSRAGCSSPENLSSGAGFRKGTANIVRQKMPKTIQTNFGHFEFLWAKKAPPARNPHFEIQ